MKLSSTLKGLITGLLMAAAGLLLYINNVSETSPLQYIGYLIYGLGIVWTLTTFVREYQGELKFGSLFNQAFRCFIVVTLIMALFTLAFYKLNTRLVEEKAVLTRQELLKSETNRTPQEIDQMIETGKKNFPVLAASGAIFQYLFIGAVVGFAASGVLYLRNKKA
ncbi:DUF4199 family protein [Niabella insulamsoli]|uniref:DUF4199 family protein n=1 Tax=Niabella insulamsoli TaxID=3144874 RepID=UPI0031FD7B33